MEDREVYMEEVDDEVCFCCRTEEQDKIIFSLEEQVKKLLNIDLEREEIYKIALEKWGAELQIVMVFEEMAELQKELSKHLRGKDNTLEIAEEIADVEIMLDQMKLLFEIENAVEKFKTMKVDRLKERLK